MDLHIKKWDDDVVQKRIDTLKAHIEKYKKALEETPEWSLNYTQYHEGIREMAVEIDIYEATLRDGWDDTIYWVFQRLGTRPNNTRHDKLEAAVAHNLYHRHVVWRMS